jgi:hypothetical protein
MPTPTTPTISLVTNRQQGYFSNPTSYPAKHIGDAIQLRCTPSTVAGPDFIQGYEWTATSSLHGVLTWQTSALTGMGTPQGTWTWMGTNRQNPADSSNVDTSPKVGRHPSGETFSNVKVRALGSSAMSAWSNVITAGATRALVVTGTGDMSAPTVTAAVPNALSGVTVTYDWDVASADQVEMAMTLELWAGAALVASVSRYAIESYGLGQSLTLSHELAPSTTYTIKMSSGAFTSADAYTYFTLASGTTLDFTSTGFGLVPPEGRAIAGEPFSIALTSANVSDVLTAVSFPAGVSITAKVGTTAQRLEGTLPAGTYSLTVLVTLLDASASVVGYTLTVGAPFVMESDGDGSVPVIEGWKDDQLLRLLAFAGEGSVMSWFLTNAPPGVVIATIDVEGEYGGTPAGNAVAISGAPTAHGIYDAQVSALVVGDDDVPQMYAMEVRFEVSGDLFLNWFHDDPSRRELQVLLRDRSVKGYLMPELGLRLVRGDMERLYVIFRDGPLGEGRQGRAVLTDGFSELRMMVRPVNDPDGEVLLELGGAALVTEEIEGREIAYFEFEVTSKGIERRFMGVNRSPGADTNAGSIPCMADVTWTRGGRPVTSQRVLVEIVQDCER